MKGLIIKKEWLDRIFSGEKIWEIRGMFTHIRGKIALIESKSGEIKGTCEIVDCKGPFSLKELEKFKVKHAVDKETLYAWGGYKKGNYCYELSNVKKFKHPVPYKHPSGAVIWVGDKHIPLA